MWRKASNGKIVTLHRKFSIRNQTCLKTGRKLWSADIFSWKEKTFLVFVRVQQKRNFETIAKISLWCKHFLIHRLSLKHSSSNCSTPCSRCSNQQAFIIWSCIYVVGIDIPAWFSWKVLWSISNLLWVLILLTTNKKMEKSMMKNLQHYKQVIINHTEYLESELC